jgi:hypothetical protein
MKHLLRWSKDARYTREDKKTEYGDLALSVIDLLAGSQWNEEDPCHGPHGVTDSERLVLRGFALDDPDLSQSDWRSYSKSNLILWGDSNE